MAILKIVNEPYKPKSSFVHPNKIFKYVSKTV